MLIGMKPISISEGSTPLKSRTLSLDIENPVFKSSLQKERRKRRLTTISSQESLESSSKQNSKRISMRDSRRILREATLITDSAQKLEKINERVKDNFNKRRHDVVKELTKGLSDNDIKSIKDMAVKRALNRTEKKNQNKITILELFNNKVAERIECSKRIMNKLRTEENPLRVSVIHAVLAKSARILEAHIDECLNDFQRGIRVNTTDQHGRTALHYASSLGQLGALEMLLYVGVDPRIRDCFGRSALHYASLQDNKDVVDILINLYPKAIRLNERLSEQTNDRSIARLLKYRRLRKMAKVKNSNIIPISSYIPITVYVDVELFGDDVNKMIERMAYSEGSNIAPRKPVKSQNEFVGISDHLGRTALHMAALCNKISIIRALVDHGSDCDAKDFNGKKAVDLIVSRVAASVLMPKMRNPKKIIKTVKETEVYLQSKKSLSTKDLLLMDEDSLLNYQNGQLSENYMIIAVKKKSLESVKVLLERKLSPLVSNKNH